MMCLYDQKHNGGILNDKPLVQIQEIITINQGHQNSDPLFLRSRRESVIREY